MGTYQLGLTYFADSIALNRAAGCLEVILRQYGAAVPHLSKALAWVSSDHEGSYYLGLALEADGLEANGDDRGARIQWEFAQQFRGYHAPAMMSLAALAARGGDRAGALAMVQEVLSNRPRLTRAGGMEIALLRALRRTADAKQRLLVWRRQDPASSFLAYEAMRLGDSDPDLLAHLAAVPSVSSKLLQITCVSVSMTMRSTRSGDSIPPARMS
jgi:hypothetical protein